MADNPPQADAVDPAASAEQYTVGALAAAADYVTAAGALLTTDAIEKINAGAGLAYALYHAPAHLVAEINGSSYGFQAALMRAQQAYGIGGH